MNNDNTILKQMLEHIPINMFDALVAQYKTEKHAKGFTSWTQFVTMIFAQIAKPKGLTALQLSMKYQKINWKSLGIQEKQINKSTLSYVNAKRNYQLYEQVFYSLLEKIQNQKNTKNFRFKNPLYSIDASTIDLCFSHFKWAEFRKNKAGIKLHVKYDNKNNIPCYILFSNAKEHEVKKTKDIPYNKNDILVFDKGYTQYSFYLNLCNTKTYFVTRLKKNACYKIIKANTVKENTDILSDEIISIDSIVDKKGKVFPLRKIVVRDDKTKKILSFLTNNLSLARSTIANIYKERWQIELFFKALKQNLKIKQFYGYSKNAVLTQIWIALIVYLLFHILKQKAISMNNNIRDICFSVFICTLASSLFSHFYLFDLIFDCALFKSD